MALMTQNESHHSIATHCANNCPQCDGHFVCDIAQGRDQCWCMKFPAVLPVIGAAKCLCPNCLSTAIDEAQSTPVELSAEQEKAETRE